MLFLDIIMASYLNISTHPHGSIRESFHSGHPSCTTYLLHVEIVFLTMGIVNYRRKQSILSLLREYLPDISNYRI